MHKNIENCNLILQLIAAKASRSLAQMQYRFLGSCWPVSRDNAPFSRLVDTAIGSSREKD